MSRKTSTTSVSATALNYDHYTKSQYDRDIVRVIPAHRRLHAVMANVLQKKFTTDYPARVLDLGTGTGLTAALVRTLLPKAQIDVVDFSRTMLRGAKQRLGSNLTKYIQTDYSTYRFTPGYDLIITAIGFHHQTDVGKRRMFKKIYRLLKPNGIFLLGDLMTYRNPKRATYEQARHVHHMVAHASNKRALSDWAYHHLVLNKLTPVEDQMQWLRQAGFHVRLLMQEINTMAILAEKNK